MGWSAVCLISALVRTVELTGQRDLQLVHALLVGRPDEALREPAGASARAARLGPSSVATQPLLCALLRLKEEGVRARCAVGQVGDACAQPIAREDEPIILASQHLSREAGRCDESVHPY